MLFITWQIHVHTQREIVLLTLLLQDKQALVALVMREQGKIPKQWKRIWRECNLEVCE